MSKKSNGGQEAASAAGHEAEREAAEVRALLAEQDAWWQVREEQARQHAERLLDQTRQQLARDNLEAAAEALELYREQAIAQAAKSIAPQFIPFITGSSREAINAQVEQAKTATAEILAEVSQPTAGDLVAQAREERIERFAPAEQPEQPQPIDWENLSLDDWVKVRGRYVGAATDRGIFR